MRVCVQDANEYVCKHGAAVFPRTDLLWTKIMLKAIPKSWKQKQRQMEDWLIDGQSVCAMSSNAAGLDETES